MNEFIHYGLIPIGAILAAIYYSFGIIEHLRKYFDRYPILGKVCNWDTHCPLWLLIILSTGFFALIVWLCTLHNHIV